MAAVLTPPPTLNHLPPRQRARLLRSTRKLGAVLGAQPVLLEIADPYEVRPSRERADLHELLPLGPGHSRSKSLSPAPVPSPTKASIAPATQRPVRQGRSSQRDNFLNLKPSRSLREPRSFSASAQNRKTRANAPQPLILSVQPVEVDPSDPRLLEGTSTSKSPLQPSSAADSPSPPRRANTNRKFSNASRASSCSTLTVPASPSASTIQTPLTPSFRFRAPEIPAERRRKMARLGRMLGENVPPELVFPSRMNHLESFWDEEKKVTTPKAEKMSREGRGSSEWLLVGSKSAGLDEEDMGIPPSASPPRKLAHVRARSASSSLPPSASPFNVVFPPFNNNGSAATLDSRRPSEVEVALATIPSATPSTPTPPEKSFRASNPDVPMDVDAEMVATPTTKLLLSLPSPTSSPSPTSNRVSRHKRRSASLGSLARPLQLHLKLGTGGGAWQAPAEWAVGPSPPDSPTPLSTLKPKGRKVVKQAASMDDSYVPRAGSLDSMMSPRMRAGVPAYAKVQENAHVWAKVTAGIEVLPPEQQAIAISKEKAEREREKERMKKRRGYLEVLDQLRSLRL